MKRIFTLLLLCLMAVATWAGVRVVVFEPQDGVGLTPSASPYTIEKDCVMLEVSNGLVNENHFRVYKGQTLSISVCYGNIVNIEFQCTASGDAQYGPGCFSQSVGDYAYQDKIGLWTGSAPQVTFVAQTNQVRITKIIVTVDDGDGLSAPIISPSSGTYYEPFEATITCYTTGATIHYTTNGSDPDAQSPVYTTPILVNLDMTIKAVAILDGEMSDVVSANYTIASLPSFNCFEDLEPLDDNTEVHFTSPIYVVAQTNRYLFVKDGCGGYALIYGDVGQIYYSGDVIPAGFVVTRTTYFGEMELIHPVNFLPAAGNIPVEPEHITLDQVGHELFAHYVMLEDVTIIEEDGVYYAVDSSGNRIPLYFNRFECPIPPDLTRHYDITAIIGSYGSGENVIYELLPITITPHDDLGIGLGNYWKYYNPENPNPYEITFDYDATVILQSGNYLYAKDETGYGLIYGPVGQTYSHGDVIPSGFSGKVTYYDGWPELAQPLSGFQPPKAHVEVVPEEVTIPQIGPDLWAHYVIIKNVIVDEEKGVIRDENGNELPIYIRPGLSFTYPSSWIDIRGIVSAYRGIFQLLVWDIDDGGPEPLHCLRDASGLENSNVSFKIKLVVIYQNGVNLYAQDLCEDYILMYGNVGGEFVNGDTIEGVARWTTYQNQKQLMPVGDWVKVGHGLPVEPEDAGCTEEVSQDMCHWYVRFENVEFVTEDGKTYIEDECGLLLVYNKFNIEIPGPELPIAPPRNPYDLNDDGEVNIADINCLIDMILSGKIDYDWTWTPQDDGEMKWNVSGFLSIYNNLLEFYPVEITSAGGAIHIIGDLNDDGELNIADLNEIIDKIIANV